MVAQNNPGAISRIWNICLALSGTNGHDLINLEKSEVLQENLTFIQNPGDTITFQYAKPYAGYLEVFVNSTSITTFVTVQYDAFEFSFDETQVVGRGGLAVFPILPSDEISVIIGNENFLQEATITIRITYHY